MNVECGQGLLHGFSMPQLNPDAPIVFRMNAARGFALAAGLAIFLMSIPVFGVDPTTVAKQGGELLKTDIMGVFAHPDDETGAAATLAAYARGHHAVIANVYCTRGEGGGNMVGTQGGAALGILREAELRDCLARLGVRYCYFLDRNDWAYTESLIATWDNWDKEQTLERLVRLVRALRPEVILTMNPAPSPGQHGNHQAAGVLATEAFSAAADSSRFPAQLHQEGLSVWQPRKLYFIGKSGNPTCVVQVAEALPDGQTPGDIAARALVNHRSQAFGSFAGSPWLKRPQSFTLIKSFISPQPSETDLLEGLPVTDSELKAVELSPPASAKAVELSFVPVPALSRYRLWVKQQHIEHSATLFRTDLPLVAGQANEVQISVENNGLETLEGVLRLQLPARWNSEPTNQELRIDKHGRGIPRFLVTPSNDAKGEIQLVARLSSKAKLESSEGSALAHLLPRAQVTRVNEPPSLDATDHGWETLPIFEITPTQLVEGHVKDDADSSAKFRIAHDGRTLFVDVQVKDDVVVTNIAPNDIKGHWRSDSVEICVDPVGGSEHTFGCYKMGIFPFDTTGVVRGERDADAHQGPIEETAPGARLRSFRTPDGYRIKVSIPFAELGLNYPQRRGLGFNLIIYDGDKADAALGENINKSRIAWSPRAGVQGRPEDWGRLELQ
jgi:LmbE family N-acetylglucosaminyl deacetylase